MPRLLELFCGTKSIGRAFEAAISEHGEHLEPVFGGKRANLEALTRQPAEVPGRNRTSETLLRRPTPKPCHHKPCHHRLSLPSQNVAQERSHRTASSPLSLGPKSAQKPWKSEAGSAARAKILSTEVGNPTSLRPPLSAPQMPPVLPHRLPLLHSPRHGLQRMLVHSRVCFLYGVPSTAP